MSGFGGFGSSAATPSSFTGFGQNNSSPAKPSVFGSTSTSTPSHFGAFSQQNQNNAQQPAQQSQQQSNPFGGFGATASTANPTPAFGTSTGTTNPASTAAPAPGGTAGGTSNIFGSFASNTTSNAPSGQQQQPSTAGAFGSTLSPPAGNQSNTGSSLFGSFAQTQNQPNIQQPASSTNIFGKSAPAFGIPTASVGPTSGSSNLFGSAATTQPGVASNVLGATTAQPTTNMFASPGAASQVDQLADASSVGAQLKAVHDAWDSSSPNCKFQYFFYNLVDESEVHKYGRPVTATNEVLWQKAVRDNPLPSRLVPVHAIGFEDLKKRIAVQKAQTEAQMAGMKILKNEITKMTEAHTLKISPRLSILSHAQADLHSRITKLVHHLHLFIPSIRSMPIRQDEELLRNRLEGIEAELKGPGGLGRIGGRVGELWGLVGRIKASRDAGRTSLDREGGWAVVDEGAFEDIKQILAEEQHGLKFVTELLRAALDDINRIQAGLDDMSVT